jgi:hypothetical protein
MQWLLAKTKRILLVGSNVELVVGPSEILYAADLLAEGMLDTDV